MKTTYTLSSLIADALSLGPHWVYDTDALRRQYPAGVVAFSDPLSPYHANRKAGQFTHYGDQTALLSRSVAARGGFDEDGWREDWVRGMATYDGYLDGASKETLAAAGHHPSGSSDLAGASRMGPILDLGGSLGEMIAGARGQARLTHENPGVADGAEFFVRAVRAIEDGQTIAQALASAAREGDYETLPAADYLAQAQGADASDFVEAGRKLGIACDLSQAFPLTLYFGLRPGADYVSAISDNALAGGDSSARGMLLALLFVARDGEKAIPANLLTARVPGPFGLGS